MPGTLANVKPMWHDSGLMADSPQATEQQLIEQWNQRLAREGLNVLHPRGKTPQEERDLQARSRRRSRGAGTF